MNEIIKQLVIRIKEANKNYHLEKSTVEEKQQAIDMATKLALMEVKKKSILNQTLIIETLGSKLKDNQIELLKRALHENSITK